MSGQRPKPVPVNDWVTLCSGCGVQPGQPHKATCTAVPMSDQQQPGYIGAWQRQKERAEKAEAERDRYQQGLIYIASQQSGIWGEIAHDVLIGITGRYFNDKRQEDSVSSTPDTSPPEGSSSAHVP